MKKISIWKLYMMFAIVMTLFMSCLYTTTALFTASESTGNVVNIETGISYTFDINSNQQFAVKRGSIIVFDAVITNSSSGPVYYELYYKMLSPTTLPTGLVVAEVGSISTTSGNINSGVNNSKTIPIMITNNSTGDVTLKVGLATGEVGNTITYNDNETKITSLADHSTVPSTSCTKGAGGVCTNAVKEYYQQNNGQWQSMLTTTTTCISGTTTVGATTYNNLDSSGANYPDLPDGMIPIMHNGSTWVKADATNQNSTYKWFDYTNQRWANAVMVNADNRSIYMEASVGTTIPDENILAYFVWIPRYRYKLFNVDSKSPCDLYATCTGYTSASNCNSSSFDYCVYIGPTGGAYTYKAFNDNAPLIEVEFENQTTEKSTGTTDTQWLTHPAFTWGTGDTAHELSGIWVGKFEMSAPSDSDCYTIQSDDNCNKTLDDARILPNATSLQYMNVYNFYHTIKNMKSTSYLTNNGVLVNDVHMMKNTEWGAVAYLKQSIYGTATTVIGVNNYKYGRKGQTGCGAATNTTSSTTCNTYNTVTGQLASTTGNIYGVYDMSGGMPEYVMGVLRSDSNNNSIMYGGGFAGFSPFNLPYEMCSNNTYLNCYDYSTSYMNYERRILGDATGEIWGWNSTIGLQLFVRENGYHWFTRGGTASAGNIFRFDGAGGNASKEIGGRATIITLS